MVKSAVWIVLDHPPLTVITASHLNQNPTLNLQTLYLNSTLNPTLYWTQNPSLYPTLNLTLTLDLNRNRNLNPNPNLGLNLTVPGVTKTIDDYYDSGTSSFI